MKTIVWSPQARADIRAIDQATAMQILKTIHRYAASGLGEIKKLQPPRADLRLRAGEWRVFFRQIEPHTIEITGVEHRREAYR
ncbi:MAG: type II toxin-antitoxin system RelE/ParE family toxin [Acidobacteriota bacterium]|nr:type II toxin-antitoxin system RelE/ParE family toxin [Acidobacteriota bacterium]